MHFVVKVSSIVLTSLYNTRQAPSNNTITLSVIYYSLLDYGNGFDLKGGQRRRSANGNSVSGNSMCISTWLRGAYCVNMWMLLLMLLERNKHGTRFIQNE